MVGSSPTMTWVARDPPCPVRSTYPRRAMLKIVLCLTRKPGMSREEFSRYWRETHAPLVRKLAPALGMRRNVHNHALETSLDAGIRAGRGAEMADYDGVAESWFDSLEALLTATATDEGRRAARRLAEDEARFIDFSRSR